MNVARAVALGLLLSLGCGAEPPPAAEQPRELRELILDEPPGESAQASLFERTQPSIHRVIAAIDEARSSEQVGGLLVRIGSFGGAWARARDLAEAFAAFRAADKPVHCYVEQTDNAGYALAARACDRIAMTPAGTLDAVGVAAQMFFARTLLENVGVRADVLQMGRFKSFAEPFTRDEMSPELRESMGLVVDDLHADLVDALVQGRRLEPERAQALLDGGPYDADAAREAGLIDAVAFDDEVRSSAKRAANATRIVRVDFGGQDEPLDFDAILRTLSGEQPNDAQHGRRIALVYLDGNIVDAEESGPGAGRSGPFVRHLRTLRDDDDVRAVVLRIASPGGSAMASDRMWHAVRMCARKKPVIVSFGDVAASGGYYVAAGATEILGHRASIVGSIGVIAGKADLSPLLDRIGVNAEILARGRNAAWSTATRGFTDSEREVLTRSMRATYDRFLSRVASGRDMPTSRVAEIAEGRVWSGRRGLELGLIDREGGLRAAIALARERAEIGDEAPLDVWPRERGLLETIAELLGGGDPGGRAFVVLREAARGVRPLEAALELAEILADERAVLRAPIVFDVR